jgi:hypothetical protein
MYIALVIFGLGLAYKTSSWFRHNISEEATRIPTSARVSGAIKGIIVILFSAKIFTLIKAFAVDVLLQVRI